MPNDLKMVLYLSGAFAAGLCVLAGAINYGPRPEPVVSSVVVEEKAKIIRPSAVAIEGDWQSKKNGSTISLSLSDDGIFEITLSVENEEDVIRYVYGDYTYDEKKGILTLVPNAKVGRPDPVPGKIFKVLTKESFDILNFKKQYSSKIFWMPPRDKIATRNIHPLFYFSGGEKNPVLIWEPVEHDKDDKKKK